VRNAQDLRAWATLNPHQIPDMSFRPEVFLGQICLPGFCRSYPQFPPSYNTKHQFLQLVTMVCSSQSHWAFEQKQIHVRFASSRTSSTRKMEATRSSETSLFTLLRFSVINSLIVVCFQLALHILFLSQALPHFFPRPAHSSSVTIHSFDTAQTSQMQMHREAVVEVSQRFIN
jgi:hypothetical protein